MPRVVWKYQAHVGYKFGNIISVCELDSGSKVLENGVKGPPIVECLKIKNCRHCQISDGIIGSGCESHTFNDSKSVED